MIYVLDKNLLQRGKRKENYCLQMNSYYMPEMGAYDPQTLQKVYFQEFLQLRSGLEGNLSKKMV
jgi:hypothetical protein